VLAINDEAPNFTAETSQGTLPSRSSCPRSAQFGEGLVPAGFSVSAIRRRASFRKDTWMDTSGK
jgi:hypothetical protein